MQSNVTTCDIPIEKQVSLHSDRTVYQTKNRTPNRK